MRATSLAIFAILGIFIAGCGSGNSGDTNSTTSTSATGGSANSTGGDIQIAVIPKGSTHDYWKHVHQGANEAAKELGVTINFQGPEKEDDKESQIRMIETMISKGVKGIVLAPLDDQALAEPVANAKKAGIPVVIIDSGLSGSDYISMVSTDNEKGGHMAGQEMIRLLGDKGGKIAVLRYAAGSASTDAREKGFIDEIKSNGKNIQIVSMDQFAGPTRETAAKASENLLAAYRKPDGTLGLDGIYCPNESSTAGMLKTLENNNWAGKVKFVGFDAAPDLIDALNKGEIDALVVQNPEKMGHDGVKVLVDYIKGNKDVPKMEDTGATLVTKANVNSPEVAKLVEPAK